MRSRWCWALVVLCILLVSGLGARVYLRMRGDVSGQIERAGGVCLDSQEMLINGSHAQVEIFGFLRDGAQLANELPFLKMRGSSSFSTLVKGDGLISLLVPLRGATMLFVCRGAIPTVPTYPTTLPRVNQAQPILSIEGRSVTCLSAHILGTKALIYQEVAQQMAARGFKQILASEPTFVKGRESLVAHVYEDANQPEHNRLILLLKERGIE